LRERVDLSVAHAPIRAERRGGVAGRDPAACGRKGARERDKRERYALAERLHECANDRIGLMACRAWLRRWHACGDGFEQRRSATAAIREFGRVHDGSGAREAGSGFVRCPRSAFILACATITERPAMATGGWRQRVTLLDRKPLALFARYGRRVRYGDGGRLVGEVVRGWTHREQTALAHCAEAVADFAVGQRRQHCADSIDVLRTHARVP
jgi:hypothetical protein